jgi:uncharacterized membrane protein
MSPTVMSDYQTSDLSTWIGLEAMFRPTLNRSSILTTVGLPVGHPSGKRELTRLAGVTPDAYTCGLVSSAHGALRHSGGFSDGGKESSIVSTSGEEQTTHDKEVSGSEIREYGSGDDRIYVVGRDISGIFWRPDTQSSQGRIELKDIYERLSPESATRILNMVEREQDYEKQARRSAWWLNIFKWIAIVTSVLAVVIGSIFIGLNSKSSASAWTGVGTSFLAGGALGTAAVAYSQFRDVKLRLLKFQITISHKGDESSDNSRQDIQ